MSEITLYRCVDGFEFDRISIFHNKHFGRLFSAVMKLNVFSLGSIYEGHSKTNAIGRFSWNFVMHVIKT